jgi:acyl-CoA synthetase (AMP-forming)/AMP-acid ligase II
MTNLAWHLRRASNESGESIAIVDIDGSQYTYDELESTSNRIAKFLREDWDVAEDDIVAALLPSSFWTVAFMFGAMKAGAAFSPENYTLEHETLIGNLNNTNSVGLIYDESVYPDAPQLAEEADSVRNAIPIDEFRTAVADHSDECAIAPRHGEDLAGINYTSGTTGRPKAVQLTHGTVAATIAADKDPIRGISNGDLALLATPMYHIAGITAPMISASEAVSLVVMNGWDVDKFVEHVRAFDLDTFLWMAPTWVRDTLNHDAWGDLDLTGIDIYLAGGPGQPHMYEELREAGARASCIYGMTETMGDAVAHASISQDEDLEMDIGSVGTPARELGEVKIVGLDDGSEITEPHEEGEICWRGDNLTPGYYNDPERTAEAIDEDGWFHTDDLGYFDEDGQLYVSGRADDMIISGEEKLSLAELDDVLLQHEVVEDAGTIGVDHERFGEVPAAFVVPKDNSMTESELKEVLDEHMLETLARWKRPRLYAIVDEIPRTHSKQSKIAPDLESHVNGVVLEADSEVTTLSAVRTN